MLEDLWNELAMTINQKGRCSTGRTPSENKQYCAIIKSEDDWEEQMDMRESSESFADVVDDTIALRIHEGLKGFLIKCSL